MSITLVEIRTQARQRADMVNSQFVEDAELNSYINSSLAELHDLLISAYNEEYYMESVQFTAVAGTMEYALPNGTNYSSAKKFYKMRGLDVAVNSDPENWQTVKRFNFNKRNQNLNNLTWNLRGVPFLEYRLVGENIRLNRVPETNTVFRLWYNPAVVKLINDTDSYDDINGFAEYVIVDAAIKMLQKEESDVSVLMAQKEALKARITSMAQNRDANEPESVSDIYAEDNGIVWGGGSTNGY